MATSTAEIKAATQTTLDEFAAGIDGKRPERLVVETAARIANAALLKTVKQDISFDDEECAVSFDLELSNGHLILAELWSDGSIDASVYDEKRRRVKRMPKATETEMLALFQE